MTELEQSNGQTTYRLDDDITYLDANEHPYSAHIDVNHLKLNRYPDPQATVLKKTLAEKYQVEANQIFVSSGISQIIPAAVRTLGSRWVSSYDPSYPMYANSAAKLLRAYVSLDREKDLTIKSNKLTKLREPDDIVFIANPNNPTGNFIDLDSIKDVAENFPGTVFVDEAYGEFGETAGMKSAIELVREDIKNVLVARSFSKSYGAAGIGVGYAIGSAENIDKLQEADELPPLNSLAQSAATELLQQKVGALNYSKVISRARDEQAKLLTEMGCDVLPSVTNFLCFGLPSGQAAKDVQEKLMQDYKIAIRHPDHHERTKKMLRVSIGNAEANSAFINAMRELLK